MCCSSAEKYYAENGKCVSRILHIVRKVRAQFYTTRMPETHFFSLCDKCLEVFFQRQLLSHPAKIDKSLLVNFEWWENNTMHCCIMLYLLFPAVALSTASPRPVCGCVCSH
jgi:hypothetical protein